MGRIMHWEPKVGLKRQYRERGWLVDEWRGENKGTGRGRGMLRWQTRGDGGRGVQERGRGMEMMARWVLKKKNKKQTTDG